MRTSRLFGIDGDICVVHAGHAVVRLSSLAAAVVRCKSWGEK